MVSHVFCRWSRGKDCDGVDDIKVYNSHQKSMGHLERMIKNHIPLKFLLIAPYMYPRPPRTLLSGLKHLTLFCM